MSLFTISSLLPVLIITLIALIFARLMVRDTTTTDAHEFASIDGLRGFLAIFVFIHHAVYWFSYGQHGKWSFGASSLFMNFGHASVSLFFMLTGFLFSLKLIDGRQREIDWLRLYCSRVMRLTPLYVVLCLGVFFIVAYNSHFAAYETPGELVADITDWLLFTIPGHPDINGHLNTHLIPAGVIWTLPYEWYFYLSLPLLGLLIGSKSRSSSGVWLILSAMCLATFSYWQLNMHLCLPFVGGAIAAIVVRTDWLRQHLTGRGANIIAAACFIAGYYCFKGNTNFARLVIFTTGFTLIACGATLFGILNMRSARALSTISYGIYLLHGIILYTVIVIIIPKEFRTHVPIEHYWIFIFLLTPVLVAISSVSWHIVELPAINSTTRLTTWIRSFRNGGQDKITTSTKSQSPFIKLSNRDAAKRNRHPFTDRTGNPND